MRQQGKASRAGLLSLWQLFFLVGCVWSQRTGLDCGVSWRRWREERGTSRTDGGRHSATGTLHGWHKGAERQPWRTDRCRWADCTVVPLSVCLSAHLSPLSFLVDFNSVTYCLLLGLILSAYMRIPMMSTFLHIYLLSVFAVIISLPEHTYRVYECARVCACQGEGERGGENKRRVGTCERRKGANLKNPPDQ